MFTAIESLHDTFIRPLTPEEKEAEKCWMDKHVGFKGLWREGWLIYDGTIVVLYAKPGMNGQGYYTRKANYGLNVQVCSTFSIHSTPSNIWCFRSEMFPPPSELWIILMGTLALHTTLLRLRVLLPSSTLTGYLRARTLPGVTLHTVSARG